MDRYLLGGFLIPKSVLKEMERQAEEQYRIKLFGDPDNEPVGIQNTPGIEIKSLSEEFYIPNLKKNKKNSLEPHYRQLEQRGRWKRV